jgi:hypothetical protein
LTVGIGLHRRIPSLAGMVERLRAIAGRHSKRVWLLYAIGVLLLLSVGVVAADPALWAFAFDPELLALFVAMALPLARLEWQTWVLRVRRLARRPTDET